MLLQVLNFFLKHKQKSSVFKIITLFMIVGTYVIK